MDTPGNWSRYQRGALYVGGMMGPLGTFVMLPMIPELRATYGVTTGEIGWAIWCYMLPFAGFLLVSGTLADRLGRERTQRWAMLAYAAASLGCAAAPNYGWFLAARSAQGALNSFFTPILLSTLTATVSVERLGRVVGRYSAMQGLGQLMAPLLGGIGADINWRLGFIATAAVGTVIWAFLPGGAAAASATTRASVASAMPRMRTLVRRPTLLLGVTALCAGLGAVGAWPLAALSSRDTFGLSGLATSMLLVGGGVAGIAAATAWGLVLDRWGGRRAAVVACLAASTGLALMSTAQSAAMLAVIWFFVGGGAQTVVVSFQSLASVAEPENRSGAVSFVMAHRFAGHALGALVWLPLFTVSPAAAYLGSGAVGALGAAAVLASGINTRRG